MTSKYIARLQNPFKEKFMNRKNNYKFKLLTIQATIDTIFVNEKIIRIYSFVIMKKHKTSVF